MDGVDLAAIGVGTGGTLGVVIGFLKYAFAAPERERRASSEERAEIMKAFREELKEDRKNSTANIQTMLASHEKSCSSCRDLMTEVARATLETATIVRTCVPRAVTPADGRPPT